MAIENRNLEPGTKLTARYKKEEYSVEVVAGEDGKVLNKLPDGREFKSPSLAGTAVTGKPCNGWAFWSVGLERRRKKRPADPTFPSQWIDYEAGFPERPAFSILYFD